MRPSICLKTFILLCVPALMLVSCSRNPMASRIAELNETEVLQLVNCYTLFQGRHGHKGPRDESEFMTFLRGDTVKQNLKFMGIEPDGIADLFISDRDGKPYKIKYGVQGSPFGSNDPVVFEAEGLDGKVMVGFTEPRQEEMDLGASETLFTSKKKAKPIQRSDGPQ